MIRKTEGEELFEQYLAENKLKFKFETLLGRKRPDYLILTAPNILVEVEDLGIGDLDKNVRKQLVATGKGSWSNPHIHNRARDAIEDARKQLAEFKGKYPCVALIYRTQDSFTSDLNTETILGAMYGDIQIVWSRLQTGETLTTTQFNSKRAKLRKNQATTISAVAILEKIKPFNHLFTKPLSEYMRTIDLKKTSDKLYQALIEEKASEIENLYPNINLHLEIPRLRIIHNMHAIYKLPVGIMGGKYDQEICFNEQDRKFEIVKL